MIKLEWLWEAILIVKLLIIFPVKRNQKLDKLFVLLKYMGKGLGNLLINKFTKRMLYEA